MQYLKADTITEVTIGPAVAVGDGFTPVTNLVGSTADEFEIIKHGATTTTTIAGTLAAITGADGYYALDLSATDTNTEGRLTLLINDDSLILPLRHEFMVVNANVFDSLFAASGTDILDVNVTTVSGTGQTANDNGADINTLITEIGTAGAGLTNLGASGNNWNVGKTGYTLTATTGLGAQTANITGNLSGSVGSVTAAVTLPTIPTDWLTAAGTAADFGTEVGTAVWATTARILTASTNFNDITAGEVWAVDATTQQVQGTFGQAIGDPVADTTTIYQAVATDAAGDNVSIDVIAVKAQTAAIETDTGEIGTAGAGLTNLGASGNNWNVGKTGYSLTATTGLGAQTANITGNLSGSVGSVTGNVGGNVTGSVGSNLELGPTEVNAEVVDVLFTDTDAEPAQGLPAATTTLADKIGFLYKAWRNRSNQTATTYQLFNDDAVTVDHKATVSDDTTTAEKGEVATGP